jgi:hypothetical protein
MVMTSKLFITIKNKSGCSAVLYNVCNLILLFSVVCFVIRAVLKFYFRLLQTAHIESDNWWKVMYAFIETCSFDRTCFYSPQG